MPEVLARQTRRSNILPGALALNLHPLGLSVDEALAAREALEGVLEAILGCEICKAGEGNPLPFERAMVELLLSEWGKATKKGTAVAVEGLMARSGDLSPEEMEGILDILDNTIEENFGRGVEGETYKIFNGAYRRGKSDIYRGFRLENVIDWDAFDNHAVDWLNNHHLYWIGGYYNKTISGKIGKVIGEGMKEGLGREAIGGRLKGFFQNYPGISNKPDVYWRGLAANGMNRARNFGMIKGYEELRIGYLEVLAVMDERTSEICKMMNGKIIPVANAAGQRDAMMAAKSPEDVKTISPWLKPTQLKGLDTKGIMGKGVIMPPYHFHCRTTVVAAPGEYATPPTPRPQPPPRTEPKPVGPVRPKPRRRPRPSAGTIPEDTGVTGAHRHDKRIAQLEEKTMAEVAEEVKWSFKTDWTPDSVPHRSRPSVWLKLYPDSAERTELLRRLDSLHSKGDKLAYAAGLAKVMKWTHIRGRFVQLERLKLGRMAEKASGRGAVPLRIFNEVKREAGAEITPDLRQCYRTVGRVLSDKQLKAEKNFVIGKILGDPRNKLSPRSAPRIKKCLREFPLKVLGRLQEAGLYFKVGRTKEAFYRDWADFIYLGSGHYRTPATIRHELAHAIDDLCGAAGGKYSMTNRTAEMAGKSLGVYSESELEEFSRIFTACYKVRATAMTRVTRFEGVQQVGRFLNGYDGRIYHRGDRYFYGLQYHANNVKRFLADSMDFHDNDYEMWKSYAKIMAE